MRGRIYGAFTKNASLPGGNVTCQRNMTPVEGLWSIVQRYSPAILQRYRDEGNSTDGNGAPGNEGGASSRSSSLAFRDYGWNSCRCSGDCTMVLNHG